MKERAQLLLHLCSNSSKPFPRYPYKILNVLFLRQSKVREVVSVVILKSIYQILLQEYNILFFFIFMCWFLSAGCKYFSSSKKIFLTSLLFALPYSIQILSVGPIYMSPANGLRSFGNSNDLS